MSSRIHLPEGPSFSRPYPYAGRLKLGPSILLLLLLPVLTGFSFPGSLQRVWRQADRAFNRKQYDRAQELYLEARRQRPQDWKLMYNAAVATAANKGFDQAISDFGTIAKDGPQELREAAEFNAGNCCMAQEQADKAIEHYKRALYLKPDDLNAKWNLELAKRQKKQQQKDQQQQQKQQPKPQDQKQQQKPQDQKQQQQQQQQQQMNQQQAKQLLQSLSQQDRDLQKKMSKYRNQPTQEGHPSQDW